MCGITEQEKKWRGEFGEEYIKRNNFDPDSLDKEYKKMYGVAAMDLNMEFIGGLDRDIKILEVGCNIGNQILLLQKMGFKNLYGIEINPSAVEQSKKRTKGANIVMGSAFDLPFKDKYFDLVFTSGVLIHINPLDLEKVMREIDRCSGKYIWGCEYYSDKFIELDYRGNECMMWKGDYAGLYMETIPDLELVKDKQLKYIGNDNVDMMFLLKK